MNEAKKAWESKTSEGSYARSDLACESNALGGGSVLPSDVYREEERDGIRISRLTVRRGSDEARFGKTAGTYISFMCGRIWLLDEVARGKLVALLSGELRRMCAAVCQKKVDDRFGVLVVGLGNARITPDAIGPQSVARLNVTRHLRDYDEGLYRTVGRCEISAFSPGVLGQTGIETVELIRGAVKNAEPDVVVAIDALAARACERLAATVQLSDSGIAPGSGVGNHRKAICRETVGVPVVALGVPTVVDSSTLVYDALHRAGIGTVEPSLRQVLENGRGFFVSPKETDVITECVAELLANAVDAAFTVGE